MKKTLLQLVQDILSASDGDEVNSIFDTVESTQVANIVRTTYEAMMTNRSWPHLEKLVTLTPSSDPSRPTHMYLPDNVKNLLTLNYNKSSGARREYQPIKWFDPDDFLRATNRENSTQPQVLTVVDPSGIEVLVRNDRAPTKFTSFDNKTLVFDAYDSSVESSLQASKVQARAEVYPTWEHKDDFVPDLPAEAFPALFEEALSTASLRVRQVQDAKAEQNSARQQRWLSRNINRLEHGVKYPDYGRRGRKGHKDVTFRRD